MSVRKTNSEIRKKRERRNQRGGLARLFRWLLLFAFLLCLAGGAAGVGLYFYLSKDLPVISSLEDYRPPVITTVYSDDGRKIAEFFKERRVVLPLSEIPDMLIEAFLAAEDARFYKHQGVDPLSVIRAAIKNIRAGGIVQGGSTITQQVTKSFFLTPERSYRRKIKEAILAWRIDRAFSKEEILYLYLNQIYLGHGAYGVEAACENYFGKTVKEINLAECAILAGLPQAPSRYSPFRNMELAKQRQIYVLNRMVEEKFITNDDAAEAINTRLDIKERKNWYIEEVPFFTEYIRQYVEKTYGSDMLLREGLQVHTTVNIEMQKTARAEVDKGLRELDKRQGYRGAPKHLPPEEIESFSEALQAELEKKPLEKGGIAKGVVIGVDDKKGKATIRMGSAQGVLTLKDMKWARKPNPDVRPGVTSVRRVGSVLRIGDVIDVTIKGKMKGKNKDRPLWSLALEQTPAAQSALMSLETDTGHVKVMVGGRDFKESQFNRAIQSRRQPGSAFKPILYAGALDKGYTPATVIYDTAEVHKDLERDFKWKPKNYKEKFYGPTLFREALVKSRNLVTVKILRDIGIQYAIDYARKMGITSELSQDLSIALGSSGVSLLEILTAYSVFANQGYLVQPVFITKIVDRDGNVLEQAEPSREKVIEKSTAYIMTSIMESVIKSGTGQRVRALKRPAAGKTGTSNNLFDAWFVGFTPRYVTGVWAGFDEERTLGKGENGARTASPIWLGYMQKALKDKPSLVFNVPEGVVFAKIDAKTGLLPIEESEKTIFECFKEGEAPTKYTKRPDVISEPEDLFMDDM